jgi:hypothetical protein
VTASTSAALVRAALNQRRIGGLTARIILAQRAFCAPDREA